MKFKELILFAFISYECSADDTECPNSFVKLDTGCYYFSSVSSTWLNAFNQCKAMGATLATIESEKENNAIKQHVNNLRGLTGNSLYWISGTDSFHEGYWIWMPEMKPFQYHDWCPKGEFNPEPNGGTTEQCSMLMSLYNRHPKRQCWADFECTKVLWDGAPSYFICKYNRAIKQSSPTQCACNCTFIGGHCKKILE